MQVYLSVFYDMEKTLLALPLLATASYYSFTDHHTVLKSQSIQCEVCGLFSFQFAAIHFSLSIAVEHIFSTKIK